MSSTLCVCDNCNKNNPGKVVCCCDGMCSMRTPIINAVRRHALWPRTFSSGDLARVMHEHLCPMVELVPVPVDMWGPNPTAPYNQYVRVPLQTSSLVLDRDFHLMFDVTTRFGLGTSVENMKCHGFIQLILTDEIKKRLRFIGTTEYVKVLDSDVVTIVHDLMTTIDEHMFLGSRHIKIEGLDLTNNDLLAGTGTATLVKNTVLKFDCLVELDCEPYCEAQYGYCPGCLDDEVTIPQRKDKPSGNDDPVYEDVIRNSEIQPTTEVTPDGGDIPPKAILVVTPTGVSRIPIARCPGAPRKSAHRSSAAALRSRRIEANSKCTQCNEVHESTNPCHQQ